MKKQKKLNIIISGANSGIGYYMVLEFLKQGHFIVALDVKIDHLMDLQNQYTAKCIMPILCDVSDDSNVKKSIDLAINTLTHIDYMIHNACLCTFDVFEQTNIETFKQVFEINYFGAIHLMKHIIPHFKKQNQGHIFITSSGVGVMGFKHVSPYASSKAALESLVKCLSIEYLDKHITFHLIHPPLTKTESSSGLAIPSEFMANPIIVGQKLARRIHTKKRIITYTKRNRFVVFMMYLMPVFMGKLLSKMTIKHEKTYIK